MRPETSEPSAALEEPPAHVDQLATDVIASALTVHKTLGPGFLESVYEAAMAVELSSREIPFERQAPVIVEYRGYEVGEGRVDLLVGGDLIVELKAVEALADVHVAQLVSYLRASRRSLGLLINFNLKHLRGGVRRVVVGRF